MRCVCVHHNAAGVRAIRARYPNADPEVDKYPMGYITAPTSWLPPRPMGNATYISYGNDTRQDYVYVDSNYMCAV